MSNHLSSPDALDFELETVRGKRIVITGGTTGIGRATALLLAAKGARVLVFGRHEKELNDALQDIQKFGEVYGLTADAAKQEEVSQVFQLADEKLGGVDILVNNAAIGGGNTAKTAPSLQEYEVQANLLGYIRCAREALKRMPQGSHIINVGSMSAETKGAGNDIYVATKSAIRGWSKSLRKELKQDNIRVTLIEPGMVDTDLFENMTTDQQREMVANQQMLKAEDIAWTVYITLTKPKRCNITQILIEPIQQEE